MLLKWFCQGRMLSWKLLKENVKMYVWQVARIGRFEKCIRSSKDV